MSRKVSSSLYALLICTLLLVVSGCGAKPDPGHGLRRVVLQTDWFAQPEHGGFYQALANGFYEEVGLDVHILQGGPNAMSVQKVLSGRAHFAMNRADTIRRLHEQDVPAVMVMATLQHDPQALMMHEGNPVNSFMELDGQRVIAVPGLAWIQWIEAKYDISLEIIPHDFGMERFISDPGLIQQCLITNEPFYVKQAGVRPKVLPLRDSGFDPYHGVYCLASLIDAEPELVRAFVSASLRGWEDYMNEDPSPAFALIAERNPRMTQEFMQFSYQTMKQEGLVTGFDDAGNRLGWLSPVRMSELVKEMKALDLIPSGTTKEPAWYTTGFLVRPADVPPGALP